MAFDFSLSLLQPHVVTAKADTLEVLIQLLLEHISKMYSPQSLEQSLRRQYSCRRISSLARVSKVSSLLALFGQYEVFGGVLVVYT